MGQPKKKKLSDITYFYTSLQIFGSQYQISIATELV